MKDVPGSEPIRALLHRITRTRNNDPAILQYKMKQLQASPRCRRAMVEIHVFFMIIML